MSTSENDWKFYCGLGKGSLIYSAMILNSSSPSPHGTGQVRGTFHKLRPPHGQAEQGGWEYMAGKELQMKQFLLAFKPYDMPLGWPCNNPILALPFKIFYLFLFIRGLAVWWFAGGGLLCQHAWALGAVCPSRS